MKKKFVFWIAKTLKVDVYEKQVTEIINRTSYIQFSTIDVRKIVPLWKLEEMQMSGEIAHFKNELAIALANKMISDNKVSIEQYTDEYDRMHHIRLLVEVADQKTSI
jgi:hypothetical protein